MKNKKWLPLAILGVTLLIVFLLIKTKPAPILATNVERSWTVEVEETLLQQAAPQLALLGSTESPSSTQLTSALVSDVQEVPAREGDRVEQNQVLVVLDPEDFRLQLSQRTAEVEELQALIQSEKYRHQSDVASLENDKALRDLAKREVERQQRLQQNKLTSEERLDAALGSLQQRELTLKARELGVRDHGNRLRQLQARLNRAQAQLDKAQLDLDRTQIRAPFAGIISAVHAAPGDRVNAGQPLVEMYDNQRLEVRAQIPDRWITATRRALAAQQPVTATGDIQGQTISLTLDRLSGRVNERSGGVDGLFTVAGTDLPPLIGRTLSLQMALPPLDQVYTAPISSLYGSDQLYLVQDGRLQAKRIELLGHYITEHNQQRMIFAPGDIGVGTQFIVTQLPQAISGLKVDVRKQAP
jgi:HlyD family secretion protein